MWVKLAIIIVVLIFLLAIKTNLSLSILIPGLLLAILSHLGVREILISSYNSLTDHYTLKLFAIVYLVLLLVEIQKYKGSLQNLVRGMEGLFGNKWLTITLSPALIGLLPMPGGALVSAPVLNEALPEEKVSPELKTFINFWFRHIWEYFWPLYQGFLVTVAIFGIRTVVLMKNQFYFTAIAAIIGYLVLLITFPKLNSTGKRTETAKSFRALFQGTWEILLIVILILGLKLELLLSLSLVVLSSLFLSIPNSKKLEIIKGAFNHRILLLLASVMLFKGYIMDSEFSLFLKYTISGSSGILPVLLVSVPFTIGFLTGVNTAFAGIAFPLFAPIVGHNINYISLLYISGFSGVLLSPLHLCLVLSAEYYEARLIGVYKYLTIPVLTILTLAIIIFV